ncbi:MAG: hypothetical protein BWY99_02835 [Synergistetes bacterium ADurb.BinA166]|nr:MAG: hypothetical protein BWY99_02835 [Synergistetes bacterium ADurb.BinA166]
MDKLRKELEDSLRARLREAEEERNRLTLLNCQKEEEYLDRYQKKEEELMAFWGRKQKELEERYEKRPGGTEDGE